MARYSRRASRGRSYGGRKNRNGGVRRVRGRVSNRPKRARSAARGSRRASSTVRIVLEHPRAQAAPVYASGGGEAPVRKATF